MLFDPRRNSPLAALRQQIRRAADVTPELMGDVMEQACSDTVALNAAEKRTRIRRLIEAEAWTDAALALIDLGLPGWTLRRLVHEDGEWLCTLSSQWQLPEWLDDTVEASHDVAAMAILGAFVEALESRLASAQSVPSSVARGRPEPDVGFTVLSCDDFA